MKTLTVDLEDRSYPIYIGSGLLNEPELLDQHITGKNVFIVSNETVAPLYLKPIQEATSKYRSETCILPDGEQHKNLDSLNTIFTQLLERKFDRKSTLIALGGGVIGDITGFAAACYQRGISFIQIPTTLLAQVDSSVGGKTAVNHPLGKNMIGAFHQPNCVIADIDTLKTLPAEQISAGLAEVIKYGLIEDYDFFLWLENNIESLLTLDPNCLIEAVEQSCKIKAEVVSKDEQEQNIRAILNLGHTFGHAIETHTHYREWLHGQAVAAGCVIAALLSQQQGDLNDHDIQRIKTLFTQANLPIKAPESMSADEFINLMGRDKKVIDGTLRLILMKKIGKAVIRSDIPQDELKKFLQQIGHSADSTI